MDSFPMLLKLVLGATTLYVLYAIVARNKSTTPLPPGPKPLPLVGNIADLPPKGAKEWEHWLKHKDLFGPISSVTVLGTTIILIHDAELAFELMEKRGNIHSDRSSMVFSGEMCGWANTLAGLNNGGRFRAYRKQIHQVFGSRNALATFDQLQDVEVSRFLLRTMQRPDDLVQNIRTEAGAIILKIAYGYTIDPHNVDPLVSLGDQALKQFSAASAPGVWMVDNMPALRYLPEWMPGAGFKKTARQWHATLMELAEKPLRFVKQEMATKCYDPSFVSEIYDKSAQDMNAEEQYVTKWAAASLYAGGADTSVITMTAFFLAMTLHPEVQEKAREEIDRIVGTYRLPTLSDRENLPYVGAVVKEALRWHTIAPMGLPHVASQDDICRQYQIPKGAMLLSNIWWFCHDPKVYSEPLTFDPERFLVETPPPNPTNYIFGFGRRICPGRFLAESSVWLTIAKSLAAFDITKGVDKNGNEIEPSVDFLPGFLSYPAPFKTSIKPRSSVHEELIRAVQSEHPWDKNSAKALESIIM